MLGLGLWSLWQRWRDTLYRPGLIHWAAVLMGPLGFVAVVAGWVTTEVGRQPYTVYGLLRTADSVAPIAAPAVAFSLAAFVVIYFLVFGAGIFYMLRLMGEPPRPQEPDIPAKGPIRASGIMPAPALESSDQLRKPG